MIDTWKFLAFTQDLVFSFSSRQCGTPQRSPRPPALVLEGFSSEERLEPGPGPLRCTSSSPPSRSHACPPPTCWAEGSRWWWCPRPGPRPRAWWHRVLSFPHRAPPLHRVEAFLFHAVREDDPDHPTKKGRKTSALRNWSYFLWENFCVAAGWGHWVPPTRTASHRVRSRRMPARFSSCSIWWFVIQYHCKKILKGEIW